MPKKHTELACLLTTACVAAALFSTGCRSMPGRNMFGFRSKPSADALAGSGPTTTYPAPPSTMVKPEAIASVAGGTAAPKSPVGRRPANTPATAQVAGFNMTPGYATPASNVAPVGAPNMAAAQANGAFAGSMTTPAGYKSPAAPTPNPSASSASVSTPSASKPSGYTFGSKAFNPKSPLTAPATSYAEESNSKPAAGGFTVPSTSFTPPPSTSYTKPPATSTASGFTLPTDSPAMAAIAPPGASPEPKSTAAATPPAASEITPTAATGPEFSTASAESSRSTPSETAPSASTRGPAASGGTYMPGSTGTASGYPTGDASPTTSGSYFR